VKPGLRAADALKGPHDVQRERDEPVVIGVGQFTLGLCPDELVWIELRRFQIWGSNSCFPTLGRKNGLKSPVASLSSNALSGSLRTGKGWMVLSDCP